MGAEFGRLFQSFAYTAFRLETRERYVSANEAEALRQFAAGREPDMGWFDNWLGMIGEITAAGKVFRRVRVVSRPLSEYSRFGLFCSRFTTAAGEDIRYLDRDHADAVGVPQHDFWLFDSHLLVVMHFDGTDTFLGGEVTEDPAVVLEHSFWRDAAWHHAVRRDDFAAE